MPQQDEQAFRRWYGGMAKGHDLNPDPDAPGQFYDYRAAFRAGATPDATGHWPSDYKLPGHPRMVVGGFNVQTGERVLGTPRLDEAGLIQQGWEPDTAKRLAAMPEQQQPEVVIVGADGKEHVFPPGFDPKKAASIVSRQSAPAAPRSLIQQQGGQLVDMAKAAGKTLWGNVSPLIPGTEGSKQVGQSIASGQFFVDLAKSLVGLTPAHAQEAQKMVDAAKAGNIGQAAQHAVGMLPLMGPWLSEQVELVKQGKGGAAAGNLLGMGITMKPGAVLPVGELAQPVAAVLKSSARKGVQEFLGATTRPLKAEARVVEQGILNRGLGKGLPTRQSVLDQAVAQAGQPAEAGRQATFGAAGRAITREEAATAAKVAETSKPVPVATDYRGSHTAPVRDGGSPLHDVTGTYPDDVYGPRAAEYYGHYGGRNPQDMASVSTVQRLRGKPDAQVTVYRAVPLDTPGEIARLETRQRQIMARGSKDPKEYDLNVAELERLKALPKEQNAAQINAGDWVTITRSYAKEHGESALDGRYKIISKAVKAKDIFTDGNSIHEWGYDPAPKSGPVTAQSSPGIVPAQPVLDVFDKIIARSSRTDIKGKVVPRVGMEERVAQAKAMKKYLEGYGEKLSFESAADLKRDYQAVADKGKQFMADDPTKAKAWVARKASTSVRRELLKVNPDLEQVWAEYGFWKGLRDVLQHTQDLKRSQDNWGSKMKALIFSGGTGTGAALHGGTVEGLAMSAGAYTLARAVQSPTWKLVSAQLKNSLADAIASGEPSRVTFYLNRVRAMSAAPQLMRIPQAATVPVASHGGK